MSKLNQENLKIINEYNNSIHEFYVNMNQINKTEDTLSFYTKYHLDLRKLLVLYKECLSSNNNKLETCNKVLNKDFLELRTNTSKEIEHYIISNK